MKQWPAYQDLAEYAHESKTRHLASLFTENPQRFEQFHAKMSGLLFDYSKQNITAEERRSLIELAEQSDLKNWIDKLFAGKKINITEDRAAGHIFLRDLSNPKAEVQAEWQKMETLVKRIHSHQLRGFSGKAFTDVVNIGVGGSDLGPLMITNALDDSKLADAPDIHFVSTLDGKQLQSLLKTLNAETTLFGENPTRVDQSFQRFRARR